ncbi:DNA polymerase III subunit delta' [Alphaproteobacteria bacterium]|nr:DNA polymerase III subunit delta' [Alphaproteobacteria bacterium]
MSAIENVKYLKPRENPDLIGHKVAEERFLSAWRSSRLPHGWLVTGPRGIGKATFAFRLARFVLANGRSAKPTNLFDDAEKSKGLYLTPDDPVFRRIASGAHPDLTTLERSINHDTGKLRASIAVSDVRDAGDFMRLTASEGGWRVVVVDSIDEMNVNAANALLKTLEEPPTHALLLLVSHAPGRLLPTIRSRCCQLPLKLLAGDQVSDLLTRQRPDLSEAERHAIASLADGSPGRALALAQEDGLTLYRELMLLLSDLPRPPVGALHGYGDKLARNGAEEKFRATTALLGWWLGRLARSGARGEGGPSPIVPEEEGLAVRMLAAARVEQWMEVWEKVNRLADDTSRLNLDRKQALLSVFYALQSAIKV